MKFPLVSGSQLVRVIAMVVFVAGGFLLVQAEVIAANATASDFLKFIPDPQSVATGDSILACYDSPSILLSNPALAVNIYQPKLSLNEIILLEGMRYHFAGFALPTKIGVVGGSISYLSYGDIDGFAYDGSAYQLTPSYDISAVFSYSIPIKVDIPLTHEYGSVGLNVKFIHSKLTDYSAEGLALDVGGVFKAPLNGLSAGFAFKNLGTPMKFAKDSNPVPASLDLGVRYDVPKWNKLFLVAGLASDLNNSIGSYSAGASVSPLYSVTFYGGWIEAEKTISSGLRLGISMDFDSFSLKYALSPLSSFSSVHYLGFDIPLGNIAVSKVAYERNLEHYFQQAKDKYYRKDYIAARQQLEEILSVYPGHNPSKEYLHKISIQLDKVDQRKKAAVARFMNEAEIYLAQNDITGAKKYYERILNIIPGDAATLDSLNKLEGPVVYEKGHESPAWKKAINAFNKGEYVLAKNEFEDILAAEPSNEEAHKLLIEIDKKIIGLDAPAINNFYRRAIRTYKGGKYELAKKYFEAVVEADPQNSDAQSYILRTLEKISDVTQGIKSRELIAQREGLLEEVAYAFSNAIRVYTRGNNYEALEVFIQCRDLAVKYDFKVFLDKVNTFIANMKSGFFDEYCKTAENFIMEGNIESALEEYRKALIYDSESATVRAAFNKLSYDLSKKYYKKGSQYLAGGDMNNARQAFEKSLLYNPNNEESRKSIGEIK